MVVIKNEKHIVSEIIKKCIFFLFILIFIASHKPKIFINKLDIYFIFILYF